MKWVILIISLFLTGFWCLAQKMEVEGAVLLGESDEDVSEPGTIRWTGTDFEGRIDTNWVSLTGIDTATSIADVEGTVYRTVHIGNQVWMRDNLKTSRYSNGELIPIANDFQDWADLTTPAWTYYDTVPVFDDVLGKLYNYFVVADTNTRNICPVGWHVPTNNDWDILIATLGGVGVAGEKMKSTYGWVPGENGNNESGFSGAGGGLRNNGGYSNQFGLTANYWSSTDDMVEGITAIRLGVGPTVLIFNAVDETLGFSVRCIKD